MIYGYIRVSTEHQDKEIQKDVLLRYAQEKKILIDTFFEVDASSKANFKKRVLTELMGSLTEGDHVIVTELSRLGRSVSEVTQLVNQMIEKKVRLTSLKENIDINGSHSTSSKMMVTMISLFAELERDLISQRTKEALATKKKNGARLGRPKGPGKSKLDEHRNEIAELLQKKVSISSIAKILSVNYSTLYVYIKDKM